MLHGEQFQKIGKAPLEKIIGGGRCHDHRTTAGFRIKNALNILTK